MPFLVVFIVLSLSFYIYYKVKYVRSNLPMEKKYISGKSSMALGLFIGLFGINQLYLYPTTTTYIVAALFIIMGTLSIWAGYKAYRFYLPHAIKEAEYVDEQS
ncbi:YtpI family protein [Falsibacillus albus]|uniref:YtpI family protein n=1 Tax=Falsibacillus albus TaxID=2478915 RepID=A0A3L7KBA3_9BACI|nr:YtpI family protein [Falsibacillus albus]RLQ97952.1 hypothetical protein D9X91_00745 [Falsibacillus albus]